MTKLKRLSNAQDKVIECLRENPTAFVLTGKYYHFQKVLTPDQHPDPHNPEHMTHHLLYFTIPTRDVLLRYELLIPGDEPNHYILNRAKLS